MLLHLGNERERNFAIIQGDITDIGPGWPDRLMDDLQHSEVGVDTLMSISSMEKTCDQRLLDVELIQRRADNALMVVNSPFIRFIGLLLILHLQVTNLLAQKEIEWQHSMENSQKTIAIVTMFFLPATFFAILFTLPLFNWDDPDEPVVRRKIWIYWVFTGASTIAIFTLYFSWDFLKKKIPSRSKKGDVESQNVRPVIGANGEEKEKEV
ncbi:hypothetical protein V8E51_002496 [Hyaloscypha variabilis]